MGLSDIYARLRNILNIASFKKREDKTVTVESDFSRTIEAEEFFPYGFFAKAKEGSLPSRERELKLFCHISL